MRRLWRFVRRFGRRRKSVTVWFGDIQRAKTYDHPLTAEELWRDLQDAKREAFEAFLDDDAPGGASG